MAFKHGILFATDLAANFGCNRFRIAPDIVSKLSRAAIWSSCAGQFESEQTPFPQTGHWYRPAALHRIRLGTCGFVPNNFLCHIFAQRRMYVIFLLRDEWMIERFSEAMGDALVGNNFLQILWKFHFTRDSTSDSSLPEICKALKSLEMSQYCKSGSMFSSSEPIAASSDCCWLGNTLCLC